VLFIDDGSRSFGTTRSASRYSDRLKMLWDFNSYAAQEHFFKTFQPGGLFIE